MQKQSIQILNELVELCGQYKVEIPGRRRAWPKSIKERIFNLQALGVKPSEITKRTGISKQTIYVWNSQQKKKGENFLPVKIVSESPTVTVRENPNECHEGAIVRDARPTVTVITPSGFRIEGLNKHDLILFLNEFRT